MWEKNFERYLKIIEACPDVEKKGKTVPYTSANGYMFSQLNKDGEIGIRLSKEACKAFKEKHNTTEFRSYGAVMRDYVLIPDNLLDETEFLASVMNEGFQHVMSLPPK